MRHNELLTAFIENIEKILHLQLCFNVEIMHRKRLSYAVSQFSNTLHRKKGIEEQINHLIIIEDACN